MSEKQLKGPRRDIVGRIVRDGATWRQLEPWRLQQPILVLVEVQKPFELQAGSERVIHFERATVIKAIALFGEPENPEDVLRLNLHNRDADFPFELSIAWLAKKYPDPYPLSIPMQAGRPSRLVISTPVRVFGVLFGIEQQL